MKRSPALGLLALSLTLPGFAQRGSGGRVGSPGAGGAGSHGSSTPVLRGSAGGQAAGSTAVRSGIRMGAGAGARPVSGGGLRQTAPTDGRRAGGPGRGATAEGRFRRPYVPGYGLGYPIVYPAPLGFIEPGAFGFGDDNWLFDQPQAGPNAGPGFAAGPDQTGPEETGPAPIGSGSTGAGMSGAGMSGTGMAGAGMAEVGSAQRPEGRSPYRGSRGGSRAGAEPSPSEDSVTLIFRDGRAPEQIHNYMVTRSTLYVRDGRGREIPLDDIDVAATQRLNGDVGVEFRPPGAVR